jgi:membrane protease YdiL (CAAX protease family)
MKNIWGKIFMFFLLWLLISAIFYSSIYYVFPGTFTKSKLEFDELLSNNQFFLIYSQFVSLMATILAVFIFNRYIDRKRESNFHLNFFDLLLGVSLGFIMIAACILILMLTGNVRLHFKEVPSSLFYYFLAFIFVAISEELFARGFILHNLYQKKNVYVAIIISSIIFTLLHLLNSSISLIAVINLFLTGILLSVFYLRKVNLSIPIGVHLSWNFFQGPIFGFSVSGLKTKSVFSVERLSSDYLTGGEFGLEGSVVLTAAIIFFIVYNIVNYKILTKK